MLRGWEKYLSSDRTHKVCNLTPLADLCWSPFGVFIDINVWLLRDVLSGSLRELSVRFFGRGLFWGYRSMHFLWSIWADQLNCYVVSYVCSHLGLWFDGFPRWVKWFLGWLTFYDDFLLSGTSSTFWIIGNREWREVFSSSWILDRFWSCALSLGNGNGARPFCIIDIQQGSASWLGGFKASWRWHLSLWSRISIDWKWFFGRFSDWFFRVLPRSFQHMSSLS